MVPRKIGLISAQFSGVFPTACSCVEQAFSGGGFVT
jgi:hypothetical protein